MRSEKPILSITVAADLVKLHPRTLMLYEKAQLISPHRTTTNRRMYSKDDLAKLQFIKFLTQQKGVNLQGVFFISKAIRAAEEKGNDLKKRLFPDYEPKRLI